MFNLEPRMDKTSLKSLTADQLVKLLSQDVVDILKDSARRGTAYLVEYCEWANSECPYVVWGKYPDTTPKGVLYRIIQDSNLGSGKATNGPCEIFHSLLYKNESLMEGHEIFKEYLQAKKDGTEYDYDTRFDRPELIEYLYTKVKRPEDLIEDLRNSDFGNGYRDCFIVFEDDSYWRNSIRYRCSFEFGIKV